MYFTNGTTYFYTPDEAKVYKLVNSSWEVIKPTFDMMARMAPHLKEVNREDVPTPFGTFSRVFSQ